MDLEPDVLCKADQPGGRIQAHVAMYLLDTSQGYVLVDTGNDTSRDPGGEPERGPRRSRPVMTPEHHPARQLALVGITPDDVRSVIYTHLHADHAGGAGLFPRARHIVQAAEYRFARRPDPLAAASFPPGNPSTLEVEWQLLDGDAVALDGVHLMLTPGHTPGHQSVVLWDVPDLGPVILAGDAIPSERNLATDRPPGVATDATAAMASMRRLTALAEALDATIMVGHRDPTSDVPVAPHSLVSTRSVTS